jgi:hypothetical protein
MDIYAFLALKKKENIFFDLRKLGLCFGKEKWTGEKGVCVFAVHPNNYGQVSLL